MIYLLLYNSAISVLHEALKKAIAVPSVTTSQTSLIRYFQTFSVSTLPRLHYEGKVQKQKILQLISMLAYLILSVLYITHRVMICLFNWMLFSNLSVYIWSLQVKAGEMNLEKKISKAETSRYFSHQPRALRSQPII